MPITRTPIVDDSTGLTGTPFDNAWKQEFYNQIDALALAPLAALAYGPSLGWNIPTQTVHNVRPPNGDLVVPWLLYPPAVASVDWTGIQAEADGRAHLLINATTVPITFYTNHAGSTAANRIIVPGYAASYALTTWMSIWVHYDAFVGYWVMQKP